MRLDDLIALDQADTLATKRDAFDLPPDLIYLNGNSLGPLPVAARHRLREAVDEQWGQDLVASWNKHRWIDLPALTGDRIAGLIGAAPGQVLCCDSVSVNLFKLLCTALALRPDRRRIISLKDNFPTDLYIASGLSQLLGEQRCQLHLVERERLQASLAQGPAVLMLTQVDFRSGALLDMAALTAEAHNRDSLVIWDLSHSVGVIPLRLDDWQVDFAVGCGYKYLNGGPGAPAFLYVAQRHIEASVNPLSGWMGHQAPFDFSPDYTAAAGIDRFQTGTPPILSLSALDAALEVFDGLAITTLREKSQSLMELFITLLDQSPELTALTLVSPREPSQRGSQLALRHPAAFSICRALEADGVMADFRSPDLLRLGFSPLILRFTDVWHCIRRLERIMAERRYQNEKFERRHKVT